MEEKNANIFRKNNDSQVHPAFPVHLSIPNHRAESCNAGEDTTGLDAIVFSLDLGFII